MTQKLKVDREVSSVVAYFRGITYLETQLAMLVRRAFDEVIDGERTGRWSVAALEKTEKTYIGTKVEILLRHHFSLERGVKLDNLICGIEVDTKFSLSGAWMIPREAIGEVCLLLSGDEVAGRFSAGVARATEENLTPGGNQDGKRQFSADGKTQICWLVHQGRLPANFFYALDSATRASVLSARTGQQRVLALFRNVIGQIIPRSAVAIAARQVDPAKRARDARKVLAGEGIDVLSGRYDAVRISGLGFAAFDAESWLAVRRTKR